jgi:hypothetical protein
VHFMLNVKNIVLAWTLLLAGTMPGQANCGVGSLNGVYPFTASGLILGVYDSSGVLQYVNPPLPFSAIGQYTFDGQGNFTRVDYGVTNGLPANTASTPVNGSGFRTGQTGTYTIDEDCTGQFALNANGATLTLQVIVADYGLSARAIVASEHVPGFANPPQGTSCASGCDEGVNVLIDLKKDVNHR